MQKNQMNVFNGVCIYFSISVMIYFSNEAYSDLTHLYLGFFIIAIVGLNILIQLSESVVCTANDMLHSHQKENNLAKRRTQEEKLIAQYEKEGSDILKTVARF